MTSRSPAKVRTTPAGPERRVPAGGLVEQVADLSRHVAPLCFATVVVFIAMIALEFFYFERLSGGLPSLDLRFAGFTPDEGMAWLNALGRRGSEIIIVWHYLTFDLLFPALFSITLVSLILAAGQRLRRFSALSDQTQVMLALVLVLPYTLADYCQNIAVARLLSDFVYANPDSLSFASALIVTKFVMGAIPLIAIATFLMAGRKTRP